MIPKRLCRTICIKIDVEYLGETERDGEPGTISGMEHSESSGGKDPYETGYFVNDEPDSADE